MLVDRTAGMATDSIDTPDVKRVQTNETNRIHRQRLLSCTSHEGGGQYVQDTQVHIVVTDEQLKRHGPCRVARQPTAAIEADDDVNARDEGAIGIAGASNPIEQHSHTTPLVNAIIIVVVDAATQRTQRDEIYTHTHRPHTPTMKKGIVASDLNRSTRGRSEEQETTTTWCSPARGATECGYLVCTSE
jgi:hypothetical protein